MGARPQLFFFIGEISAKTKKPKNIYFKNEVFFWTVSIAKSEKLKYEKLPDFYSSFSVCSHEYRRFTR